MPVSAQLRQAEGISVAFDESLLFTTDDMAILLRHFLAPEADGIGNAGYAAALDHLASGCRTLPGWSPHFVGWSLGWRVPAAGWLAHQGVSPETETTMLIRFNPSEGLGFALIAYPHEVSLVADFLLAACTGERSPVRRYPPSLPLAEAGRACASQAGSYGDSASRYAITAKGGALQLQVTPTPPADDLAPQVFHLRAREHGVLIPQSPGAPVEFVQTIGEPGQPADFLWDGYCLRPRLPEHL
jgi:hypothetical protein